LFPALRGGNDNPGTEETFLGEVDDVIAAADYLARQKSVDPRRIYLGGHSTGGALALLVAESTDRFRAVFAFGLVSGVSHYPSQFTHCGTSIPREIELRSPIPGRRRTSR
jgi:poly(3-hydroxybutyrate) depolymerase